MLRRGTSPLVFFANPSTTRDSVTMANPFEAVRKMSVRNPMFGGSNSKRDSSRKFRFDSSRGSRKPPDQDRAEAGEAAATEAASDGDRGGPVDVVAIEMVSPSFVPSPPGPDAAHGAAGGSEDLVTNPMLKGMSLASPSRGRAPQGRPTRQPGFPTGHETGHGVI